MTTTAAKHTPGQRVRDYLAARATMSGNHSETIHTVGIVGGTYALNISDLEALSTPMRDAAPELLDALRQCVAWIVEIAESGDAGFWDAEEMPEVIAARAALSNLKGSTE